jgi:hypothetical protein
MQIFRRTIQNGISHFLCFIEEGEIPTKRPSFSSIFVYREIIFDEKYKPYLQPSEQHLMNVSFEVCNWSSSQKFARGLPIALNHCPRVLNIL